MVTRHEGNYEETKTDFIENEVSDKCDPSRHFTVRGAVAIFFTGNFPTVPRQKRPRKLSNVDTRLVLRKYKLFKNLHVKSGARGSVNASTFRTKAIPINSIAEKTHVKNSPNSLFVQRLQTAPLNYWERYS